MEKSNNEDLRTCFEDLSKFISNNNRLSAIDLTDFLNEPISYVFLSGLDKRNPLYYSRRYGIVTSPPDTQQNSSDSFQRVSDNVVSHF